MYRRIQGSNSPLSPLPKPVFRTRRSQESSYSTPSTGKKQLQVLHVISKRNFTPYANHVLTPEISPIDPLESAPSTECRLDNQLDLNRTFSVGNLKDVAHPNVSRTPQTPPTIRIHSINGDKDDYDSDVSVYYTPPTSFATVERVLSAHKLAPK